MHKTAFDSVFRVFGTSSHSLQLRISDLLPEKNAAGLFEWRVE
jgi:hypothetical protein